MSMLTPKDGVEYGVGVNCGKSLIGGVGVNSHSLTSCRNVGP